MTQVADGLRWRYLPLRQIKARGPDVDLVSFIMSNRNHLHRFAARMLLAACVILSGSQFAAAQQASPSAQQTKIIGGGGDDYRRYCSACHGPHGLGDGEMAPNLIKPPSDLTRITGTHGQFPFWTIYDMIAGDTPVLGHDSFQMPKYGALMKADEGKPGYLPAYIRILTLTHYLQSLQAQ